MLQVTADIFSVIAGSSSQCVYSILTYPCVSCLVSLLVYHITQQLTNILILFGNFTFFSRAVKKRRGGGVGVYCVVVLG
jgi:hypothetical protein